MAKVLTKELLREAIETVKEVYLEDRIPWICGYSGGKDSSATVQLVWMALREIPPEKRAKTVHVISTDTMVESPVVALWAKKSLQRRLSQGELQMVHRPSQDRDIKQVYPANPRSGERGHPGAGLKEG